MKTQISNAGTTVVLPGILAVVFSAWFSGCSNAKDQTAELDALRTRVATLEYQLKRTSALAAYGYAIAYNTPIQLRGDEPKMWAVEEPGEWWTITTIKPKSR